LNLADIQNKLKEGKEDRKRTPIEIIKLKQNEEKKPNKI